MEVEGRRRVEAERNRRSEVVRRRKERRVVGVKGESVRSRSRSAEENAMEEEEDDEGCIGFRVLTLESVLGILICEG